MGTLLTTPRMNTALRARVERAVSHGVRARHHASGAGLGQPFPGRGRAGYGRLLVLLAAVFIVLLAAGVYRYDRRAVEEERRGLLAALGERRSGLVAGHEGFLPEVERWVAEAGEGAAPDGVDPGLRGPGILAAWLRRPALYVRGPAADLRDPQRLDGAARGSIKDAFLLCLLSPPASSSERDLLAKVRGVYFGGSKVDEDTANVRRLQEARAGLFVLGPSFEGTARATADFSSLRELRRELDSAPVEQAKKAAASEVLIVVADGPAREARVTLVDLVSKQARLRLREHVEEQGRSSAAAFHREQLEGCALALAVRRAVQE